LGLKVVGNIEGGVVVGGMPLLFSSSKRKLITANARIAVGKSCNIDGHRSVWIPLCLCSRLKESSDSFREQLVELHDLKRTWVFDE
jgi:hypothetical protein